MDAILDLMEEVEVVEGIAECLLAKWLLGEVPSLDEVAVWEKALTGAHLRMSAVIEDLEMDEVGERGSLLRNHEQNAPASASGGQRAGPGRSEDRGIVP